jgi:hypothetical protein
MEWRCQARLCSIAHCARRSRPPVSPSDVKRQAVSDNTTATSSAATYRSLAGSSFGQRRHGGTHEGVHLAPRVVGALGRRDGGDGERGRNESETGHQYLGRMRGGGKKEGEWWAVAPVEDVACCQRRGSRPSASTHYSAVQTAGVSAMLVFKSPTGWGWAARPLW